MHGDIKPNNIYFKFYQKYTDIALYGGSGNGAIATVVTTATEVTSITITKPGYGYAIDDVLSISATDIGRESGNDLEFKLTDDDVNSESFQHEDNKTYTISGKQGGPINLNINVDAYLSEVTLKNPLSGKDGVYQEVQTSCERNGNIINTATGAKLTVIIYNDIVKR